jgi:AcrR family transcriptional regulator
LGQNTTAKEDIRLSRTRKRIQEALIELTVEKGYDAITVQDIVDRAVINRSTFYRHYLDKEDLLSKYMDEVTGITFQDDPSNEQMDSSEDPPSGLVKLLQHIQTFSAFYRIMLSANGHPLVSDRLSRKIESRVRLILTADTKPKNISPMLIDMKLRYTSGAGIGAILWWLENDTPCNAEQLAIWIGELSRIALDLSLTPSPLSPQ